MPSLDERRASAQKRLARINDKAFDLIHELAALREERKRLLRSIATMGKKPTHLTKKRDVIDELAEIVAPTVARAVTDSVTRRAARPPPGVPGGVEKARAKLAAQGTPARPRRKGGA
jgi:hypothetical protein